MQQNTATESSYLAITEDAPEALDDEDDNNDANSDVNSTNPNLVELATLILPPHAAQEGLEVGEGENVVLEARQETVDNLATQTSAVVSAVVDLEVLSELVGVSEQDFIRDLHMDVADQNRVFENDNDHVDQEPGAPDGATADENQPLLLSSSSSSIEKQSPDATTEDIMCDRVTLTADPFIETLADTLNEAPPETMDVAVVHLPTIAEGVALQEPLELQQNSSHYQQPQQPSETTTPTTDEETGDEAAPPTNTTTTTFEASATKVDDDQRLGHDAFLLNVPNQTDDGTLENHFVLALPEIRPDTSVSVMSASSVSHDDTTSHYTFPALHRALSYLPDTLELPSDVVNIQLEAHMDNADDDVASLKQQSVYSSIAGTLPPQSLHLDLVVQRQVPVIGYVILISGLVALSSVGAALDFQHGTSSTMKTLWRQLCTSLVLSPLVVKSIYEEGKLPTLTRQQWLMLPLAGAAYAYMCLAFVVALEMTTLANAFVLSNMASLVIILGRFVLGLPVLPAEGAGALLGFVGAAICARDATKTMAALHGTVDGTVISNEDTAMLGNIVALSASFGTAAYLLFAKSLRSSLDVFVFMFSVMSLGSVWLILYMTIQGEAYSWGMDPAIGIFGWLDTSRFDRLPLELFMAVVCNCMGTTGYIAVLKYFEPIVPSSVMLMEPVVGSLIGTLAGTAPLPGAETWLGDLVVAGGTFLVIWSGSKKTEKVDATEALRLTTGDDGSTIASFKGSLAPRHPSAKTDETTKVVWE